jgi:hypothetical protein
MKALLAVLILSISPVAFAQSDAPEHASRPTLREAVATLDVADNALKQYEDILAEPHKPGLKSTLPAVDPEGDYTNDLIVVRDGRKLIASLKARPEQISTPLLIAILTEVNDSIENVLSRSARLEHFTCSANPRSGASAIGKSLADVRQQLDDAGTAMVNLVLHWSQSDVEQLTNASARRNVRAERRF